MQRKIKTIIILFLKEEIYEKYNEKKKYLYNNINEYYENLNKQLDNEYIPNINDVVESDNIDANVIDLVWCNE